MKALKIALPLISASFLLANVHAGSEIKHDEGTKIVPFSPGYFKPDPTYKAEDYSVEEQLKIYGGKRKNRVPFYIPIFGQTMYPLGPINESWTVLGKKNPVAPKMMAYGDLRIAGAVNDDGVDRITQLNSRLNLDIDLALTSTERFHAFMRPLDEDGEFTGFTFGDNEQKRSTAEFDANLDTLFFEGDLAAIWTGISGDFAGFDLPFTFGLIPMIFHNAIWMEDAFVGGAFTIPAMTSKMFDISNMDITFFAGIDRINTAIQAVDDQSQIFGFNSFIDIWEGHIEFGYGFTKDKTDQDQDYHNAMFSFTHRWHDIANLSYRVIGNFGQNDRANGLGKTADGVLVLLETSWQTSLPYTFVPYSNFWMGHDKPQPIAKQDGVLKNTGILFEPDGITNFPILDPTAQDTFGAALGLQYLFNLDKQLVFELATVQPMGGKNEIIRPAQSEEYGAGLRFQIPISQELILRTDHHYLIKKDRENQYGSRLEIRLKF